MVFIVVVAVVVVNMLGEVEKDELVYSDIVRYFQNEQVKRFEIDQEHYLKLELYPEGDSEEGKTVSFRLLDIGIFYEDLNDLIQEQLASGKIESYNYVEPVTFPWWVELLPYVITIIIVIALWFIIMNQAAGKNGKMNSFGRARAKMGIDEKHRVLFSDVAGADEEKEELQEVVEFLKAPASFTKLGARIPRGVLLMGPPGTGKTLLAKAVAGEAGVPFYSISGSDFVEMYVGVGASRVRDLFETAKKSPASIIFIDEIDAVGRHRGAGLGGGHDEREQTLNQLLVEMDGFGSNDGVIVIAATNRPDILDPALLRPGRFDRQITVNYPDLQGREDILKVHAKGKPLEASVDLKKVAQTTVGFTGADLANLLNEAALLAARKRKSLIGMDDIEEASIRVIVGTQKKSRKIKESEKRKTAYHEAGHAILAHELPSQDPVRMISIIPSGAALGYTLSPPVEDKYSVYKNSLKDEISMLLGGRVAEKIIFEDVSGGASNDIQRATSIAKKMVTRYGMSDELGPILFGSEHSSDEVFLGRDFSSERDFSEETAAKIDREVKKIIDEAYANAERILRANIDKLHFIAEYLVRNETMDDAQFKAAMETNATIEDIEAMAAAKRRKSNEENAAREEELQKMKEQEKTDDNKNDSDNEPPEVIVPH
jgi:cell division protease FtsH